MLGVGTGRDLDEVRLVLEEEEEEPSSPFHPSTLQAKSGTGLGVSLPAKFDFTLKKPTGTTIGARLSDMSSTHLSSRITDSTLCEST